MNTNINLEDKDRLLRLKDKKILVDNLSIHTMDLIAEKNPDEGDKLKL